MSGEDALREALAAAVLADAGLHLDYDRVYVDPQEIADALLPVVLRYGREKAAEELRDALADLHYYFGEGYADETTVNLGTVLHRLDARADNLDPT